MFVHEYVYVMQGLITCNAECYISKTAQKEDIFLLVEIGVVIKIKAFEGI